MKGLEHGLEIGWQGDMSKLFKNIGGAYMSVLIRGKDSIEINSVRAGIIYFALPKSEWWEMLSGLLEVRKVFVLTFYLLGQES